MMEFSMFTDLCSDYFKTLCLIRKRPGDAGYFNNKNWDGKNSLIAGENVIYVGGGKFWGWDSPPKILTASEWKSLFESKGWRYGKFEMLPQRQFTYIGLLSWLPKN